MLDFMPGTTLERAARMVLAEATLERKIITKSFNDTPLVAAPGLTEGEIIDRWIEARKRHSR